MTQDITLYVKYCDNVLKLKKKPKQKSLACYKLCQAQVNFFNVFMLILLGILIITIVNTHTYIYIYIYINNIQIKQLDMYRFF